MPTNSIRKKALISDKINRAAVLLVLLIVSSLIMGCGLQIEEANESLAEAAKYQQQSEEIVTRLKAFPQEWEALFSAGVVGTSQIAQARQLVDARKNDIKELEKSLAAWKKELKAILSLNVDQKVKDYVQLKIDSIDCWSNYVSSSLKPMISTYGEIVELIAYGRPQSELEEASMELSNLAAESRTELDKCEEKSKKADEYFKKNNLGN